MSLQELYYVISITATVVFIGVMLFIAVMVWQIYNVVKSLEDYVHKQVFEKVEGFVASKKAEIASLFGMGIGSFLLSRAKDAFFRRK